MRKIWVTLAAVTLGLCVAATSSAQTSRRSGGRAAGALVIGTPAQGELRRGDQLREGKFADTYIFNGVAGQEVEFRLDAQGEFDPHLIVRGTGAWIWNNDNDELSVHPLRHSRVRLRLPFDGQYRVQATTILPGGVGAYTLSVVDGAAADQERPFLLAQRAEYLAALVARADNSLNAGDTARALIAYDEALTFEPYNVSLRINRGVARFRSDRFLEAQQDFSVALALDANNAQARANHDATQQVLDGINRDQMAQNQAAREAVYAQNAENRRQAAAILGAAVSAYNNSQTRPTYTPSATSTQPPPPTNVQQGVQRQQQDPVVAGHVHNPRNVGNACAAPQMVGDRQEFVNNCPWPVWVMWPRGMEDLAVGESYPTLESGQFYYWACKKDERTHAGPYQTPEMRARNEIICQGD
jgi:tetratricopeptide (TPR) repeat protein